MELSTLLALPAGLEVTSVTASDKLLTVHLKACAPSGICPLGGCPATHVRSYYTRFVADVPCASRHVQLVLRVRKFRCDTVSCPRKIFVERLGPFIEAWARKTTRLREAIEAIGTSTCGEVGARLASRLSIATSHADHSSSYYGFATPSGRESYPSGDRRFCAAPGKNVWHCLGGFETTQSAGSSA